MVATIVLTQNNLVKNGSNNTFVYNFPNSVSFPHHEIAVQSISMFYSWLNVSAILENNLFTIYFPANADGAVSTGASTLLSALITIPQGQYEVTNLNQYLQYELINLGMYMIDTTGNFVYFTNMVINATRYSVQINTYPIPHQSQFTLNILTGIWTGNAGTPYTGWTTPSNWVGFVDVAEVNFYNPCLFLPANFSTLLGFKPNTFTIGGVSGTVSTTPLTTIAELDNSAVETIKSFLSPLAPQVQPNASIFFSISNIDNKYAVPNTIIFSLNPAVAFGEQITEYPPQFAWNKLLNGTYNNLRLQILGLNYQPIQILDPNITIVLVIRDQKDTGITDLITHITGGK